MGQYFKILSWKSFVRCYIIISCCFPAEARHQFKEIVNTVATVIRGEDVMLLKLRSHSIACWGYNFLFRFQGEKYLMLKRRFRVAGCVGLPIEPSMSTASSLTSLSSYPGPSSVHHSLSQDSLIDPPRFQQRSPMVSPPARYKLINIWLNNQISIT